jgi:hypothetical protein
MNFRPKSSGHNHKLPEENMNLKRKFGRVDFTKLKKSTLWKTLLREWKDSCRLGENICNAFNDKSLLLAYSPNSSGGWVERIIWAQEFETSLGNIAWPHLKKSLKPGMVAHAYIESQHYGARGRGRVNSRPAWALRPCLKNENKKLNIHLPCDPVTRIPLPDLYLREKKWEKLNCMYTMWSSVKVLSRLIHSSSKWPLTCG